MTELESERFFLFRTTALTAVSLQYQEANKPRRIFLSPKVGGFRVGHQVSKMTHRGDMRHLKSLWRFSVGDGVILRFKKLPHLLGPFVKSYCCSSYLQ